jgi:hypothetical protein
MVFNGKKSLVVNRWSLVLSPPQAGEGSVICFWSFIKNNNRTIEQLSLFELVCGFMDHAFGISIAEGSCHAHRHWVEGIF